ncbi:hypothetical protein AB0M43_36345 [Longispora sp. NPDC051575]|uniref:ATP dependent DNA ligase n=1 Tax=Longispora sp. NPDC051575 TaxID=3154943 RepID=UPI0034282FCA
MRSGTFGADGEAGAVSGGGLALSAEQALTAIKQPTSPTTGRPVPRERARLAHWPQPTITREVSYRNWTLNRATGDRRLRHPSCMGWDRKRPEE